jgi:primosomal protein N' (replication factor Y) (superfamily II helicase)
MTEFCDVALPVPLDMTFTYSVPSGFSPAVGGRALVPFRQRRMSGLVLALHNNVPSVAAKPLLEVLDQTPLLDAQ